EGGIRRERGKGTSGERGHTSFLYTCRPETGLNCIKRMYVPFSFFKNDPKDPFELPRPATTGSPADALQTPAVGLKIGACVTVNLIGLTSDGRPIFTATGSGQVTWYPATDGGSNPFGDNPATTQEEPYGNGNGNEHRWPIIPGITYTPPGPNDR